MKYAPSYLHYHIVMRDFNGAIIVNEPESDALFDMHSAIRNRDELGMRVAYAKHAGNLPCSTPEFRSIIDELARYIADIKSDEEYESFVYDLDTQGPVGAPMWRMSVRALRIVRDLARNRKDRLAALWNNEEQDRRLAAKLLAQSAEFAPNTVEKGYTLREQGTISAAERAEAIYVKWADELCSEVNRNCVLLKGQMRAIINKQIVGVTAQPTVDDSFAIKFSYLSMPDKHTTLKRFAMQQRDNAEGSNAGTGSLSTRMLAQERCKALIGILNAVYEDPENAIPFVDSVRGDNLPTGLFQLPLHIQSIIRDRLENKEKPMDPTHPANDARNAEPYTLDTYSRDVKAAFDRAEQQAVAASAELNAAIEGAQRNGKVAGLDGIVMDGIRNAISGSHVQRTIMAVLSK